MDRVESLEAFVRVVDEGGFAPAARVLRRSPSMVAKHIAALEKSAGTRLFYRTTRTVTLTDAGRQFEDHARAILAQFATALNEARSKQEQPSGSLRITLPTALVDILGSSLAAFCTEHSQLNLDVLCNDEVVDLASNRIDLAIRAGLLPDSSLRIRKLWPLPRVVCASADYLARRGTPHALSDLLEHDCIAYSYQWAGDAWTFAAPDRPGELTVDLSRISHRANNVVIQRELALQGHGLIHVPRIFVQRELSSGHLVPVLTHVPNLERWVHAVYLPGGTAPMAVRSIIDYLLKQVKWEGGTV